MTGSQSLKAWWPGEASGKTFAALGASALTGLVIFGLQRTFVHHNRKRFQPAAAPEGPEAVLFI